MKEFVICQKIIKDGKLVDSQVIRDGFLSEEYATEIAREVALEYADYLWNLRQEPDYRCEFVVCEVC